MASYNAISYPSWYSHPSTVLLLGHYWLVSPPPPLFNNISLVVLSSRIVAPWIGAPRIVAPG